MTNIQYPMSKKASKNGAKPLVTDRCDVTYVTARLHRIQGQIAGIEHMVSSKRDCSAVLQQIVAVREALRQVAVLTLEQEAQGCFDGKKQTGRSVNDLKKIVEALFKTV